MININAQQQQLGSACANAINASGQVVGMGPQGAFLYNGSITNLGALPGDVYSNATGINASGQIVGSSWTWTYYAPHDAFLYSGGVMTDIGSNTDAVGINASGQVLLSNGSIYNSMTGTTTDLSHPGGWSVPLGINDSGQVAGYINNWLGENVAGVYKDGVWSDLNTLIDPNLGH
jgi:probable HAF family extracellular repeat protein